MKKIKLLAPILGIATISTAVVPMVGCSCKNNSAQQIDSTNVVAKNIKKFGYSGNLDAGTNYQFNADLSKWTNEYGKPTAEWGTVRNIWFSIYYDDESKTLAKDDIDVSQVQIIVDGQALVKDDIQIHKTGTWNYGYSGGEVGGIHEFHIPVSNSNPVKETSKISLTNIKFKSNVQKIDVILGSQIGE